MTTSPNTRRQPADIDAELALTYSMMAQARETISRANRVLDDNSGYVSESRKADALERINEAELELASLREDAAPLEAEYAERRWSRFYLVTNGNGHVHRSMACSTCFPTTTFHWVTDLSGATDSEAIEEYGEKMCTTCYPDAPADPRHRAPGRRDREALDAKAAEKAAKLNAKLEKAILPDGSPLRLQGLASDPSTLVAAQRTLASELGSLLWYGETHPSAADWKANVDTLVLAIAAKTGQDAAQLLADAQAKAEKKHAKDTREAEAHAKRMGWA